MQLSTSIMSILDNVVSAIEADRLIPLGLAVIIVGWLMWSARHKLQSRARDHEEESVVRQPPPVRHGGKDAMRRDLETLLAELQDLSRRITAEIDTRFAKLESVMRDADRRIATLVRLTHRGDSPQPEEAGAPPAGGAADDDDTRYTVIYELADAGFSPVEIARDLGKTPGEVELILNLRRNTLPRPDDSDD